MDKWESVCLVVIAVKFSWLLAGLSRNRKPNMTDIIRHSEERQQCYQRSCLKISLELTSPLAMDRIPRAVINLMCIEQHSWREAEAK